MQGAPRRSARSFFVLPLVLALLALVVFPVFARAGEIPEYEVEVPHVENEVVPSHPKKHNGHQGEQPNSKAHASANAPGNSGGDESEGSKGNGAATGNGNGNGNGGNSSNGGQSPNGGEAGKPNSGGQGNIAEEKELPSEAKGKNVSESSGGSSSPVLPILIAVVVLAAISIGVVLYRQKQSGKGPGGREPGQGSDGRVSSPNAS
jgi:cobalamin biosynthesis Mg chelatase CobN